MEKPILLHSYWRDKRKAEVYKYHDHYIVRCYYGDEMLGTRIIKEHSERYAEDAAENYVDGLWELEDKEHGIF